jgi:hypothetical protein
MNVSAISTTITNTTVTAMSTIITRKGSTGA